MTAVRDGERLACRPATLDDVGLVLQLVNACEQHDVGTALLEEGDIAPSSQRHPEHSTAHWPIRVTSLTSS